MAVHKFTRLLYEGTPIPMYGNGSTARDYTYIDDIIAGVLASLDRPFPFEILNLGESVTVSPRSLIDTLEQVSGRKPKVEQLPNPATSQSQTPTSPKHAASWTTAPPLRSKPASPSSWSGSRELFVRESAEPSVPPNHLKHAPTSNLELPSPIPTLDLGLLV